MLTDQQAFKHKDWKELQVELSIKKKNVHLTLAMAQIKKYNRLLMIIFC